MGVRQWKTYESSQIRKEAAISRIFHVRYIFCEKKLIFCVEESTSRKGCISCHQ